MLIIIILTWANNDFFNSRDLMDRLKLLILLSDLDWVIALKSPPDQTISLPAVIRLLIPLPTNYQIIARSEVPGVPGLHRSRLGKMRNAITQSHVAACAPAPGEKSCNLLWVCNVFITPSLSINIWDCHDMESV